MPRPNVIWAKDFQFDQASDVGMLTFSNVADEFTREALAMDVECSIAADDFVAGVALEWKSSQPLGHVVYSYDVFV